jgi:uncharacterized protein (TIGR03437 family)
MSNRRQIECLLGLAFACGFVASAQTPPPAFAASDVANTASGAAGPVAPGELASIFGTNLSDTSVTTCQASGGVFLTFCAGVSVLVNGEAAPLFLVTAGQISLQIPVDLTGASATLQVTRMTGGQTLQSAVVTLPDAPTAPGLFTIGNGIGAFLDSSSNVISTSNPAKPGDIVAAFGSGFGVTKPVVNSGVPAPASPPSNLVATAKITVAGQDALVSFAGLNPGNEFDVMNFQVPQGLAVGNLPVIATVGGVPSNSVLLPVGGPKVTITGVSNNASGATGIESGSWVSIYGMNLAGSTRTWQASDFSGNNLPTSLDGVSVTINGRTAAVYYISPTQLNVQAPTDSSIGPAKVQVTNALGSATSSATLQSYAPGFYTYQGKYVAAVHADGTYVAPTGYFGAAVASRPAQPGETLLVFGTGFGPTSPAALAGQIVNSTFPIMDLTQLHISIGGATASVQFAGIVASGEYQLNVVVPSLPDGDQVAVAEIGGVSTQPGLSIAIKN